MGHIFFMSKKQDKKKKTIQSPRPIDHIVLSVSDLELARDRFNDLGFNVAAVARHNFGTENAIVPFVNGTFLEPLAIGDDALVEKKRVAGNPFLVRDHAYRFRHGGESFAGGFSMISLGGTNAKDDRREFRRNGLRTGKMAVVKRPGLKIRAVFALDERSPDCTFFICERKDGVPKFDEELTAHANGALRLSRVVLVDDNPSQFAAYLTKVSGQAEVTMSEYGLDLELANGCLSVLSDEGMKIKYGIDLPATRCREGLRQITYEIDVKSLDDTALLLAQRGIEARQIDNKIVVANAPGQGAMFAFIEELSK